MVSERRRTQNCQAQHRFRLRQKQKKLEQERKTGHATSHDSLTQRESSSPAYHDSNATANESSIPSTLTSPRLDPENQVEMADQSVATEMIGPDPLLSTDPVPSAFDDMCFTTALQGTSTLPGAHDFLPSCPTPPQTMSSTPLREVPRNQIPAPFPCCHCKSKPRTRNGSMLSQHSTSSIPLSTSHSMDFEGPPSPVSMTDASNQLKISRPATLGPRRTLPSTSRSLLEHQPERLLHAHSPHSSTIAPSLVSSAPVKRPVLFPPTENGHASIVAKLLQRGADVNAIDTKGRTALHLAAERSHLAVLKVLLAAGADVNADAGDGWTPLHQAGYSGFEEGVDVLLEYGAQY